MARQIVEDLQQGFAGGLNISADSSQLERNEVRKATNARLTEYGAVQKRKGTQRAHATALGSIHGGFAWMQPSSSFHIVAEGTKVSTAPIGSVPLTFTQLSGSIDSSALVDFAAFRDGSGEVVYIADGGLLNKTTGSTLTTNIANTAACTSIAVSNQRLWGVDGQTSKLYGSAINNGDTLGNLSADGLEIVIRTFGDQACYAVRSLRSSLAIFHRTGISRLTGLTVDDIDIDNSVEGFSEQVGTIAHRSLISVEGDVYFFSEQGFYVLSETSLNPISLKIDPVIRNIGADVIPRIVGAHDKLRHEIRWYVPDVGVYVYNYVLKAWSGPWDGSAYKDSGVRAMWSAEASGSTQSQVFIGSTDGYVRLCDVGSNDDALSDATGGDRPLMTVQCHRMFFGDFATEKALRWAYLLADMRGSTTAYARWKTSIATSDFSLSTGSTEENEWGTGTWGQGTWGGSETNLFQIQGDSRGFFYDFFLYDDGPSETLFSQVRLEAFNMTRR